MPTTEERLETLERSMRIFDSRLRTAFNVANALEGRQSDATLSLPHNDSWLFEDNVDGTHPANLRYVVAANTQKIVSARLTIHLAAYRTYSSFSVTSTGIESAVHTHAQGTSGGGSAHGHTTPVTNNNYTDTVKIAAGVFGNTSGSAFDVATATEASHTHTLGTSGTDSADHTHTVSGSSFLGVTESTVASGVTVSFDGVDHTAELGGPFNADVIELNVRPYLGTSLGALHVIAMQPSGLGRIEAHLRLGVYVSAGQVI